MHFYDSSAFKQDSLSLRKPYNIGFTNLYDFPLHWHSCIEILYIIQGSLFCRINDQNYKLNQEDIIVINSRDLHSFSGNEMDNKILIIQIEPSFFEANGLMGDSGISPVREFSKKQHFSVSDFLSDELRKIVQEIVVEREKENEASSIFYSASFLKILHYFCQIEDKVKLLSNHGETDRLRTVLAYISDNFQKEMRLPQVAEVACLSQFHFSRIFKDYTGQTFTEYLRTYRIKYASHLLLTTDEDVTDIAYQSGYSSLKTFYRQFKTVQRVNPGDFRQKIANIENK